MKVLKKVSSSLVLATMLMGGGNLFALSEGNEYITLSTPIPNAQNSVYEVWSYRCTHCYSHHKAKTMEKIQAAFPDVKVGYLLVKTMGDYGKQAAEVLAYAQNEDEKAGRKVADAHSLHHKVSDAYFSAYFKKNQRWGNGAEPDKFYETGLKALGIDKAKLDEFLATPKAQEIIASYEIADPISKNFGTPGFVVNGKYEVNISKIGSPEALVEVIKELLSM
ncbi:MULTISPECIES: thiol:disulfide interchange protein DsbA/DsbL [unclassified Campylobacter]|uniref:thiol:disulfide interchange protein DsbA/DsbL n=1 Tax=unclassified Campylobacter TaxID=2593542 RepID=UPI001BD94380|nr:MULTISPECIES: thiol:disulfide interchange protein DsbA/DsbL [unclassified Campylobacter]MBZ7975554.1 thiol:disulfide interchange protein DsbA/DsbL [Campylobacter sp. RM12637]MBZ7981042.1 thiol:disulfide interchange protein DsbA/DsbL [Campylobacter sp. RM12640]MBZ7988361.1 thiol:disulfide interchange protein DsbA/DsbL [Campylobacter sp. RM12635]MBZ7990730.1 thiol:disulfide interchange protein DsbA/DsbL [Campylobacter sp. RM9331]MBZ7992486.1 thiol:disulfide interchange protein DsbA/DsbL [Camp